MRVLNSTIIKDKNVILRLDVDVPLKLVEHEGEERFIVADDYRLEQTLPTLKLCLDNAAKVTVIGHLGRPSGYDSTLSIKPVVEWLEKRLSGFKTKASLDVLENLRFEDGEDGCFLDFTYKLLEYGNFYVNEAFSAYHEASSTTVLPHFLSNAAGLRFAREVKVLDQIRKNPQRPLTLILGGAKVEDKLPVIKAMIDIADNILIGGKIAGESLNLGPKVKVAKMIDSGLDIDPRTVDEWRDVIAGSKTVVWNGPLGKVEEDQYNQSQKIAELVIASGAFSVVGGGDTIAFLKKIGVLDEFSFVSTGGGAMLEFFDLGTLSTIEALE